eukprot:903533-Prorocentrum_minimum.AAC.3
MLAGRPGPAKLKLKKLGLDTRTFVRPFLIRPSRPLEKNLPCPRTGGWSTRPTRRGLRLVAVVPLATRIVHAELAGGDGEFAGGDGEFAGGDGEFAGGAYYCDTGVVDGAGVQLGMDFKGKKVAFGDEDGDEEGGTPKGAFASGPEAALDQIKWKKVIRRQLDQVSDVGSTLSVASRRRMDTLSPGFDAGRN